MSLHHRMNSSSQINSTKTGVIQYKVLWLMFTVVDIPGSICLMLFAALLIAAMRKNRVPKRRFGVVLSITFGELFMVLSGTVLNIGFYDVTKFSHDFLFMIGGVLMICYTSIFLHYTLSSILQLIAVKAPLWYEVQYTNRKCNILCGITWTIAILITIILYAPLLSSKGSPESQSDLTNMVLNYRGFSNIVLIFITVSTYGVTYFAAFHLQIFQHHRRKLVRKLGLHISVALLGNIPVIIGFCWQLGQSEPFDFWTAIHEQTFEIGSNSGPSKLISIGYLAHTVILAYVDPLLHLALEPELRDFFSHSIHIQHSSNTP